MLADVGAGFDDELLVFAVNHFSHALDQQALGIPLEDRIPIAAPDNLDDIPAGAAKDGLEFLNNLAVAAHGAVQALQVAVDHEDQIVELFARSQGDGTQRFGLIGFSVADERPDLGVAFRLQAAVGQVVVEARLIDRHDGAETHGDRGKFPEVRHQPGVRIG